MAVDRFGRTIVVGDVYMLAGKVVGISGNRILVRNAAGELVHVEAGEIGTVDAAAGPHAASHKHGGNDEVAAAAAAANAIPKAGAGGTLAKEWLPAATTSNQGAVVVGYSAGSSVPRYQDFVDVTDIANAGAPVKLTATGALPGHSHSYTDNVSVPTATVLGRFSAGTGAAEAATLNATLEFASGALRRAALTGDVTATAGSNATTIANNAVTNAKLADVAAWTVKCKPTTGTGDPIDMDGTEAVTNHNVGGVGSSFALLCWRISDGKLGVYLL